ncbi:MAG TPA: S8 family serine peptidase [Terriglobales bacterium]|nr:S8 family serine peptidase [Terriglobales bacterium]
MANIVIVLVFLSGMILPAQNPKATDLQFHKYIPPAAPERLAAIDSQRPASARGIDADAAQQMQALQQEKAMRTPAQRKIDSNVLYTIRMLAGQPAAPGIPYLYTGVDLDRSNNVVVDITAHVSDRLLQQLAAAGAQVLYTNRRLRSIRASIPPQQIENIAASPDVIFISPRQEAMTHRSEVLGPLAPWWRWTLSPGFQQRAAVVSRKMAVALSSIGQPKIGQGSVETEGDVTHRTVDARGAFGVDGSSLKIGVLSDGVTSLSLSQATGDLPPTCGTPPCLTVLPGQTGSGDEGTAILEVIHDMAPGASLYFATAFTSITSFAQNIRDLRAAGCDIIVDDVFYFVETPFQDGQTSGVLSNTNAGVVTQAVNDVVADGALYFTSAGNEGNADDGTSGTFEGDFNGTSSGAPLPSGKVHIFGSVPYDTVTAPGIQVVGLWWADPLAGSGNDYDLYVLDSTGTTVLAASTNLQTGTQDPVELIGSSYLLTNNRLVVFQNSGASDRFFHLGLLRGTLEVNTAGEIHGHSGASGAYSVAATPAYEAFTTGYPAGPYPEPFNASNVVELFSSDGPRRIFFHGDSSAITPGNFSSTGGEVLDKPDLTAADGVSVTGVGGFGSPFFGTSAAAPAAAAVAALVVAAQPSLTSSQVRSALTGTAVDIMDTGFDRNSGSGIVMAWEAVNSLGVTGYANPALATITATENPGNNNGIIEPGEGVRLTIGLKNTAGVNAATGITATLTTATPNVYITQPGTSAYADIAAGGSGGNNLSPFTFTLAPAFACGQAIDFTLTLAYTGGPQRALEFTVPVGLLSFTNVLGTQPTVVTGVTGATGTQTNRLYRDGVTSACGSTKSFPGTYSSGAMTFDSYSFTACQTMCLEVNLESDSGISLFESAYSPAFDPGNIVTNYKGDAGLSGSPQTFSVNLTEATPYTVVVNDVNGSGVGQSYTLKLPACAVNCDRNQLPVAAAHDVSVYAATTGGTVDANIDNGSSDPEGDVITLTQTPSGPYAVGTTNVMLTVVDSKGATAQASANVTVLNPGFTLAAALVSVSTRAGGSAAQHITFTPNPGIGAQLNLACSNLPDRSACSFTPPTVAAGSGSTQIALTITTSASTAALFHPRLVYAAWLPFSALGLIGMTILGLPSKRRRAAAVALALLCLGVMVLLLGCGGGGYNGTPKGTYTIVVTGTSGDVSKTTSFTLTVN